MADRFLAYPSPKAHDIPFEAPPPASNPVIRGSVLHYLSNLVVSLPFVPHLLWSNAGFSSLRHCAHLDNVNARYDPTVIPISNSNSEAPASHTKKTALRSPPTTKPDSRFYTSEDYHNAYKSGALTPSDVVERLIPLIRRDIANRSPLSTAFVESKVEVIRKAAEASTQRYKKNQPLGVLDGVPFAVKDDVDVEGYKRYIGTSHDHSEGGAKESSWLVKKLEEEGAVLVGRLNMHELGAETTNNNPIWGTPLNAYNNSYYTGGSSGGAASAVSHGLIPFAVGSDGGGSIRIPSNYCGLYGLKPSHGRVSSAPMPAVQDSVCVRGPIASSMCDLEVSYRVLAQPDPSFYPSSEFSPPRELKGLRNKILGVYKSWIDRADPIVQEACHSALQYFTSELGYQIIDITIPLIPQGQLAHAMTIMSENIAGQKLSLYSLTPANRIMMSVARQHPAHDFVLAQRVRTILMEHLAHLYRTHPGLIIVTPTTPNAGWPIDPADLKHGVTNGNMLLRNMEYIWLANFAGTPCIQFPVKYVDGVTGKGKVPIGMSGMGEWGSEDALIEFGYDGERYLHERLPGGRVRPEGWVDVLKGT